MDRKRWLIAAGAAAVAAALARLARRRSPREKRVERVDVVTEAGLESFPASDPPSWTLGEDGELRG